jgi:hypothetical protein
MSIFFSLGRLFKESVQVRGRLWHFVTSLFLYGEKLLAPRPTSKLKDHPLSAVRDCIFNILAVSFFRNLRTRPAVVTRDPPNIRNLRTRHAVVTRDTPNIATWGRALPWWQGTHVYGSELLTSFNLPLIFVLCFSSFRAAFWFTNPDDRRSVAERSKTWTVFARSNTEIVGSNPTQGVDVYIVCLFCACVVLCIARGLATDWSPVQGVLPTLYRIKNLKKEARAQQRTVEP